ncbi:hypothetical protein BLNAU_6990 [Blattamonas nauphoetae]|uniref:Uncharacterized protein n=1 Tax=Blattamonas nauphoetae TaxID=2049346 RepID=A0ABQ9Y2U3_9EUKA|nr:hypothetical protein BLNAU_6990 [Blattamonas nauphoetae]
MGLPSIIAPPRIPTAPVNETTMHVSTHLDVPPLLATLPPPTTFPIPHSKSPFNLPLPILHYQVERKRREKEVRDRKRRRLRQRHRNESQSGLAKAKTLRRSKIILIPDSSDSGQQTLSDSSSSCVTLSAEDSSEVFGKRKRSTPEKTPKKHVIPLINPSKRHGSPDKLIVSDLEDFSEDGRPPLVKTTLTHPKSNHPSPTRLPLPLSDRLPSSLQQESPSPIASKTPSHISGHQPIFNKISPLIHPTGSRMSRKDIFVLQKILKQYPSVLFPSVARTHSDFSLPTEWNMCQLLQGLDVNPRYFSLPEAQKARSYFSHLHKQNKLVDFHQINNQIHNLYANPNEDMNPLFSLLNSDFNTYHNFLYVPVPSPSSSRTKQQRSINVSNQIQMFHSERLFSWLSIRSLLNKLKIAQTHSLLSGSGIDSRISERGHLPPTQHYCLEVSEIMADPRCFQTVFRLGYTSMMVRALPISDVDSMLYFLVDDLMREQEASLCHFTNILHSMVAILPSHHRLTHQLMIDEIEQRKYDDEKTIWEDVYGPMDLSYVQPAPPPLPYSLLNLLAMIARTPLKQTISLKEAVIDLKGEYLQSGENTLPLDEILKDSEHQQGFLDLLNEFPSQTLFFTPEIRTQVRRLSKFCERNGMVPVSSTPSRVVTSKQNKTSTQIKLESKPNISSRQATLFQFLKTLSRFSSYPSLLNECRWDSSNILEYYLHVEVIHLNFAKQQTIEQVRNPGICMVDRRLIEATPVKDWADFTNIAMIPKAKESFPRGRLAVPFGFSRRTDNPHRKGATTIKNHGKKAYQSGPTVWVSSPKPDVPVQKASTIRFPTLSDRLRGKQNNLWEERSLPRTRFGGVGGLVRTQTPERRYPTRTVLKDDDGPMKTRSHTREEERLLESMSKRRAPLKPKTESKPSTPDTGTPKPSTPKSSPTKPKLIMKLRVRPNATTTHTPRRLSQNEKELGSRQSLPGNVRNLPHRPSRTRPRKLRSARKQREPSPLPPFNSLPPISDGGLGFVLPRALKYRSYPTSSEMDTSHAKRARESSLPFSIPTVKECPTKQESTKDSVPESKPKPKGRNIRIVLKKTKKDDLKIDAEKDTKETDVQKEFQPEQPNPDPYPDLIPFSQEDTILPTQDEMLVDRAGSMEDEETKVDDQISNTTANKKEDNPTQINDDKKGQTMDEDRNETQNEMKTTINEEQANQEDQQSSLSIVKHDSPSPLPFLPWDDNTLTSFEQNDEKIRHDSLRNECPIKIDPFFVQKKETPPSPLPNTEHHQEIDGMLKDDENTLSTHTDITPNPPGNASEPVFDKNEDSMLIVEPACKTDDPQTSILQTTLETTSWPHSPCPEAHVTQNSSLCQQNCLELIDNNPPHPIDTIAPDGCIPAESSSSLDVPLLSSDLSVQFLLLTIISEFTQISFSSTSKTSPSEPQSFAVSASSETPLSGILTADIPHNTDNPPLCFFDFSRDGLCVEMEEALIGQLQQAEDGSNVMRDRYAKMLGLFDDPPET